MNAQAWMAWLKGWLERHPLKKPEGLQDPSYVQEVMQRIQKERVPFWALHGLVFPRLGLRLATAVGCAALLAFLLNRVPAQWVRQTEQEWQLLAHVEEEILLSPLDLEEEAEELDRIVLARALPEEAPRGGTSLDKSAEEAPRGGTFLDKNAEEAAAQEALKLLEEIGAEEVMLLEENAASEDELLEELKELDEDLLAVS